MTRATRTSPTDSIQHGALPRLARRWIRSLLFIGLVVGVLLSTAAALAWLRVAKRADSSGSPSTASSGAFLMRPVRVLIGSGLRSIRLQAATGLTIQPADSDESITRPGNDWATCSIDQGSIRIDDRTAGQDIQVMPQDNANIVVSFLRDNQEWSEPREYPGRLRVTLGASDDLSVINEVDVETYVACVTASEVWPGFHEETMRVQAIVARTYAIYQMQRRGGARFDLSATQGSQVYRGIRTDTTGQRARAATEWTRGLVLTWFDGASDRVFCAYYCAACGGHTQSAAIFGPEGDIEPLRGGIPCDYCRIAPGQTYRWGPVRMSLEELSRRLSERFEEVASLGTLKSIRVREATDDGRAVTIQLTGANDSTADLLPERFRLAVGASELRSTHFSIKQSKSEVIFEDGRGFGHGLGLCQWGAEGQARRGARAGSILRYYYPGSKLTRVYE